MATSSFYPRVFALVVAAVLGYALTLIFIPFIRPMVWAAFLAFLLYPLNLRLRRRFSRLRPHRFLPPGVEDLYWWLLRRSFVSLPPA